MDAKEETRRKKQAKQANVMAEKKIDPPLKECMTVANEETSSQSSIDTLQQGMTYKGKVIESFEYRFIVLVKERFRVLVHNARYLPLANQRDVPIRCVLATGDEVSLIVVKNNNRSRYDVEWLAAKCWVEKSSELSSKDAAIKSTSFLYDKVTLVMPSLLQLGLPPYVIIAPASCTYLHGFLVEGINLNEIFKIGDQLHYEIGSSSIPLMDNTVFAKKAWHGSFSEDDSSDCTHKLLEFCIARKIRKEILISLTNRQQRNTTHTAAKSFNESDFNLDLQYIKPHREQYEKSKKNENEFVPEATRKALQTLQPTKKLNDTITKISINEVKINNMFDVLSSLEEPNYCESPQMKSVASQTYSTGDIFYDKDNIFQFIKTE